jgi:hypothetical protein
MENAFSGISQIAGVGVLDLITASWPADWKTAPWYFARI